MQTTTVFWAVCGLLSVVSFSVLYPLVASQDPGYKFLEDYLSDLGIRPGSGRSIRP